MDDLIAFLVEQLDDDAIAEETQDVILEHHALRDLPENPWYCGMCRVPFPCQPIRDVFPELADKPGYRAEWRP